MSMARKVLSRIEGSVNSRNMEICSKIIIILHSCTACEKFIYLGNLAGLFLGLGFMGIEPGSCACTDI